jgi:hypothetical protein
MGCLANRQAASAAWHSFTCQGLAAARAAAPSISRAPLLRNGLLFIPVAGGLCPLAWLGGAGSDLPRCRCTWATAPGDFLFVRGLFALLVCPSSEGLLSAAGVIQGTLSSFFFSFFFKSTIYNTVLKRSPWAHNTNSVYSKTTLRIARYYTTKASEPPSGRQTQAAAHEYSNVMAPFRAVKKSRPPNTGLRTQ